MLALVCWPKVFVVVVVVVVVVHWLKVLVVFLLCSPD